MSDEENEMDFNPVNHKKLLNDINDLVKTQRIKKVARTEACKQKTEFNLVKRSYQTQDEIEGDQKTDKKQVTITNLTKVIGKNTKQKQISKQLKTAFQSEKVLKKPLEKVHAERLQRTVAYDVTKDKVARWDAIVTQHKMADQIVFPLNSDKFTIIDKTSGKSDGVRYKTEFRKRLEELQASQPDNDDSEPEEGKLTLEEMIEKRKEMRRIKMRESFKVSKARMQNKIKSKTYHKLKKREKLKEKLKEFEELKATDPEAALKELEKIEKQRVEERAGLRHRNTGTWAKNLQVRAKYDKNVKQDLEAQLALSRELTQKQNLEESSESEDEIQINGKNELNPWLKEQSEEKNELDELYSGYRKFWETKNENDRQIKEYKIGKTETQKVEIDSQAEKIPDESKSEKKKKEKVLKKKSKKIQEVEIENSDLDDDNDPSNFLNGLFDKAEEKLKQKVETKYKKLDKAEKSSNKKEKRSKKSKESADVKSSKYLEFKTGPNLRDVDDGLIEGNNEFEDVDMEEKHAENLLKEIEETAQSKKSKEINPESFLTVKSKHLITALPKSEEVDEMFQDEDDLKEMNKMSLAEAFEDDDIINDFADEVEANEKKDQDEIDLLPGWGSWGGFGVKEKKMPKPEEKSKVKKKDRVIVNDDLNEKFKKHMVSKLPFPFKAVKDFEAAIRTPIGPDFVPETAHSLLTMPEIVTKAGTIIEPMDEGALIGKTKTSFTFKMKNGEDKKKKIEGKVGLSGPKNAKDNKTNFKNKSKGFKGPKKFGAKKIMKQRKMK